MLKVLLVYGNSEMPEVTGLLPDYCDCTAVDIGSGKPSREAVIGSDLVMVFGTAGQEDLFRPVLELCRRMCTPVTVVGSLSKEQCGADYSVSEKKGSVLREFITDFRGETARTAYPG